MYLTCTDPQYKDYYQQKCLSRCLMKEQKILMFVKYTVNQILNKHKKLV